MKNTLYPSIIAIVILFAIIFIFYARPQTSVSQSLPEEIVSIPNVETSYIPPELQPLTIPHLRERYYQSQLTFDETLLTTNQYTAYLASYLSDGLKLYGLLTIPQGEMPSTGWPAVILVHGYQNTRTYQTNGSSYRAWWQGLANTGEFAVFKIDLRGHADSQGEPSGAYYSSDYIIDTLNARAALQNSELIDSGRIGLWGHSMAGNILLRAAAAQPDIPAVNIWAGAVYSYQDMEKYRITDHSYVPTSPRPTPPDGSRAANLRQLMRREGDEEIDYQSPFWLAMAPTNYLSDLQGAIQLNHAADDNVVSINYSRDLNALLDETPVPHTFYEYGGGGHNLTGATFNQALSRTIEFFRQYLLVDYYTTN